MVDGMGAVSVTQVRDDGGLSGVMPEELRRSRQIKEIFK